MLFIYPVRAKEGSVQNETRSSTGSTGSAQVIRTLTKASNQSRTGAIRVRVMKSSVTIISHTSFPKESQFCQLKGVCRLGDGTLLVPTWMKKHAGKISSCGIKRVEYSLIPASGPDGTYMSIHGLQPAIRLNDEFRDFDVVGVESPTAEKDRLIYDVTPSLLLFDMFQRPVEYRNITEAIVFSQEGSPWKLQDISSGGIRPMMLVDSRISDTKDFLWPKSLLRLLRNSMKGNLTLFDLRQVYQWKIRSRASCFRSIITTNVRTQDIPPHALLPSNVFFSANTLNRQSVGRPEHAIGPCIIKVLILNRYGKRYIEGTDLLTSSITSFAKLVSKMDSTVTIEPEVVFFEHSSFHEQVSIMQEASVVVASHGDGNANFAFLRPKAHIFEILPFGFSSDLFQNLSRAYGGKYESLRSQPDEEVFKACVRHFNADKTRGTEAFLGRWGQEVNAFRTETIRQGQNVEWRYELDGDAASSLPQSKLRRLRQCASYQRISVDVKHLARKVVVAGARQCHVQGDLSSLE